MYRGTLEPVTNQETWDPEIEVRDEDTDDLISSAALSSYDDITIIIRDPVTKCDELTATVSGGEIAIIQDGVFQPVFTAAQMARLAAPKTYELVGRIEEDDEVRQVVLGYLPVLEG